MAEVVPDAQHEFWRPPVIVGPAAESAIPLFPPRPSPQLAAACEGCGSEYMIAARFCHSCGGARPALPSPAAARDSELTFSSVLDTLRVDRLWTRLVISTSESMLRAAEGWSNIPFPAWIRYLHFHEIKRWIGLPTASLIAFLIGLGCVAGAVGISLFYRATNLAEFQAIQMWRVEWLLAATASFLAGILLKRPSGTE